MDDTMGAMQGAAVGVVVTLLMLAAGAGVHPRTVRQAVARRDLVLRVLLVNTVAVPLVAALAVRVSGCGPALRTAVLLCALAPGGPFAPVLAGVARADVPVSVGLMIVLALASVVTTPAGVALLGATTVGVGPMAVLWTVVVFQLAPLSAGMALRTLVPALARTLVPLVGATANGLLGLLVAWLVVVRASVLVAVGWTGLLTIAVVVGACVGLGLVTGGAADTGRAAALCTGVRNLALALLVASLPGAAPGIDAAVLAYGAVMLAGSAVVAAVWRRTGAARPLLRANVGPSRNARLP